MNCARRGCGHSEGLHEPDGRCLACACPKLIFAALRRAAMVGFALLLAGCSPMLYTHGVPNMNTVDAGLYRVGCPSKEGWDYLRSLGVRTYLKLTFEDECSAGYAEAIGIRVLRIEFPPSHLGDLMQGPTQDQLHQVAAILADPSLRPLAYGCLHDQDRGGVATGVHRLGEGWTKAAAWREMREHHYHPALLGLTRAWREYRP